MLELSKAILLKVEIAVRNLSTIYGREVIERAKKAKLLRIERKVLEQETPNTDFNLTQPAASQVKS